MSEPLMTPPDNLSVTLFKIILSPDKNSAEILLEEQWTYCLRTIELRIISGWADWGYSYKKKRVCELADIERARRARSPQWLIFITDFFLLPTFFSADFFYYRLSFLPTFFITDKVCTHWTWTVHCRRYLSEPVRIKSARTLTGSVSSRRK